MADTSKLTFEDKQKIVDYMIPYAQQGKRLFGKTNAGQASMQKKPLLTLQDKIEAI